MTELNTDQMKRVEALGYVKDLFDNAPDVDTVLNLADWILGEDTVTADESQPAVDSYHINITGNTSIQSRIESPAGPYLVSDPTADVDHRTTAIIRIARMINPYPRAADGEDVNAATVREQEAAATARTIVDAYGLRDRRNH